jgi:hypothetical protein
MTRPAGPVRLSRAATVAVAAAPLTTSGVARATKRAEGTVRAWVKSGRLRPMVTTQSGIRLFDPLDVARLAEEIEQEPAR